MSYTKISLDKIIGILSLLFPKSNLSAINTEPLSVHNISLPKNLTELRSLQANRNKQLFLSPKTIELFSEENSYRVSWEKIDNWEAYEYSLNKADREIYEEIFNCYRYTKGEVVFIVQEVLTRDNCGFVIPAERLIEFIAEDYDRLYNYDFPVFEGRQDLIFIGVEQNMITLFSHHGYFAHILTTC